MIKICKAIGRFPLNALGTIIWLIFIGLGYVLHGAWIGGQMLWEVSRGTISLLRRQVASRRFKFRECLETPVYGFIELLVLLPLVIPMGYP